MEISKDFKWDTKGYKEYIDYLVSIQDVEYKKFHTNLTDTKLEIIGIRVPIMRDIAKAICKTDVEAFLKNKVTNYYEDVFIRGIVIASIKDKDLLKKKIIEFSDLIDNWAVNDSFSTSLKIIKKNQEEFFPVIDELLSLDNVFATRLVLIILLDYYIEDNYIDYVFEVIEKTVSDEYYINMARAWLLCDCFIKQKSKTLVYLENNNLDKFTINKAISKMRDSYRVSKEDKEFLIKYRK